MHFFLAFLQMVLIHKFCDPFFSSFSDAGELLEEIVKVNDLYLKCGECFHHEICINLLSAFLAIGLQHKECGKLKLIQLYYFVVKSFIGGCWCNFFASNFFCMQLVRKMGLINKIFSWGRPKLEVMHRRQLPMTIAIFANLAHFNY